MGLGRPESGVVGGPADGGGCGARLGGGVLKKEPESGGWPEGSGSNEDLFWSK